MSAPAGPYTVRHDRNGEVVFRCAYATLEEAQNTVCDLIDATDMQFQRYGLASEHSKDEVRAWSSTGPFRIELPDGSETEVQWAEWDQLAAEAAFDDDEDFAHEEILAEWNRRYGTAVPEAGAR